MCGIVGFTGSAGSPAALDVVLGGLKRLEYRGYDSAGVALQVPGSPPSPEELGSNGGHRSAAAPSERGIANGDSGLVNGGAGGVGTLAAADTVRVVKRAGRLGALVDALAADPGSGGVATTGIGHTRWATHGAPTDTNAHPHVSADGRLAVIHNGIIENYLALRAELAADGVELVSETDSETVAHLLAAQVADGYPLAEAMRRVARRLDGAFTLLAVHADVPGVVVGARRNSPLVLGRSDHGVFLGSDVAAFVDHTRDAVELGQDQVVEIGPEIGPQGYAITDVAGGAAVGRPFTVDWDAAAAEKGGWPTFMAKEIHEQPQAVADTLRARSDASGRLVLDELRIDEDALRAVDKLVVVACGTAAYAGMVAKYAIEHWCRLPVEVALAHEFRYSDPVLTPRTLVVAISQSGETMDTLMAIRHAREQGSRVVAICNTYGSSIPRESDAVLYTHAGPEVAVASTKAFLAQITAAYVLGLYLGQLQRTRAAAEIRAVLDELLAMPEKVQTVLDRLETVREIAHWMADSRAVLFLGRHVGYPVALEGALKLKELAYIHAEGFAAGELKHGPIALVEPGQPVFVIVPSPRGTDALHAKVVSNIQEVRARGARTIVVAEDGDEDVVPHADLVIRVPQTPTLLAPLVTTVPLQVFALELASGKGLDVDQPRNLAKSVTVE